MLTVEDPAGAAAGLASLHVGTSLTRLEPAHLDAVALPLSITVTAPDEAERDIWVEARRADGTVLARGRTRTPFARGGTPTTSVRLGKACGDDLACDDGRFCTGHERCSDDGTCVAGDAPCGAAFACVISSCVEHGDGTGECSVTVDHALCPAASFCNPTAGCTPGQSCLSDPDCQDGSACNGTERCLDFHCVSGTPPSLDDADTCTIDGCNDARAAAGLTPIFHVPDASLDGNVCTRPAGGGPGLCLAPRGGCAESVCGDGFVDPRSEQCDDGADNPNDGCSACRTTSWVPELVVGRGVAGSDPRSLRLRYATDILVDRDGNTLVSDWWQNHLYRVDPSGVTTVIAGNGEWRYDGDQKPATRAAVEPWGFAVDGSGNVYIADSINARVREVCNDPGGCNGIAFGDIGTLAGTTGSTPAGDGGPARLATLEGAQDVAVDAAGNVYIADGYTSVREICNVPTGCGRIAYGNIDTVAGTGVQGTGPDGPGTASALTTPSALVLDGEGILYLAEGGGGSRVRKLCVDPSGCGGLAAGDIVTIAGGGAARGDGGSPLQAQFQGIQGLALDHHGNLLIADAWDGRVRELCLDPAGCGAIAAGHIDTVAGNGETRVSGDGGPATLAGLDRPSGVAVDADDSLLIAGGSTVRYVCRRASGCGALPYGAITTRIGASGVTGMGDLGPATSVLLDITRGMTIDPAGNLFFLNGAGQIEEVCLAAAGCGALARGRMWPVAGDGTGTSSALGGPLLEVGFSANALTSDAAGNLFFNDGDRVLEACRSAAGCGGIAAGTVGVVVGTGTAGFSGDGGPGVAATVRGPLGVDYRGGRLYFADTGNNRVRMLCLAPGGCGSTSVGDVTTVAGTGVAGGAGDGGLATAAQLNGPQALATNATGDLFIADFVNARVRKVCLTPGGCGALALGRITTVAGGGTGAYTSGVPATSLRLASLYALAVSPEGNLFLVNDAAAGGEWLARVCQSATGCDGHAVGTLDTIVGSGLANPGDGGPATSSSLSLCLGLAFDAAGNLFLGGSDFLVREVCYQSGGCGLLPYGSIFTVAGRVNPEGDGDVPRSTLGGPLQAAWLDGTVALAADGNTGRVRRIDLGAGQVSTVAGFPGGFDDGADAARRALFSRLLLEPAGIVTTSTPGQVLVSERGGHTLRELTLVDPADPGTWRITTLSGAAGTPGWRDGALADARFAAPAGMAFDTANRRVYVADSGNHVVRSVDLVAGQVSTVAGVPASRGFHGDGGTATAALLDTPLAVALSAAGSLYIADYHNNRVRRVELASGVITTVLGDGSASASGEGTPARWFPVFGPQGLVLDRYGDLFVSSRYALRELVADANGQVTGVGPVSTIYGAPPRDTFPGSVTECLAGLSFAPGAADDDVLWALDSCHGFWLRLTRR